MLSGPTRLVFMAGMLLLPSCAGSEPQAGPTITPTILAMEETPPSGDAAETWEGTIEGIVTAPGCSPPEVPVNGDVQLAVATDGSVTGRGGWVEGSYACGGTDVPEMRLRFDITGTKTEAEFVLRVDGEQLILGVTATGEATSGPIDRPGTGGYGSTQTWVVECVSGC